MRQSLLATSWFGWSGGASSTLLGLGDVASSGDINKETLARKTIDITRTVLLNIDSMLLEYSLSIYLSVCMIGGWLGGVGLVLCHRPHALHPNYGHSRPPIAPASGDDGIVGHVALLGRSDS